MKVIMPEEQTNVMCEYDKRLYEYGFKQRQDCTDEENAQYLEMINNGETIPDNVGRHLDEKEQPTENFYRIEKAEMTYEQRMEYLAMKQHEVLVTIRNCTLFFTVLTVLGLITLIVLRMMGVFVL